MSNKNKLILVGGGASVIEGINQDLWDKLYLARQYNPLLEVWSLNFAYMFMPLSPNAEVFCDESFFTNNKDSLKTLECPIYTRNTPGQVARVSGAGFKNASFYPFNPNKFYGKEGKLKGLFVGRDGLTGIFALSLAIAEDIFSEIYLLGYDFGHSKTSARLTHWYQDNPKSKELIGHHGLGMSYIYNHKVNDVATPQPKQGINEFLKFQGVQEKIYTVGYTRITAFENISYTRMFELL